MSLDFIKIFENISKQLEIDPLVSVLYLVLIVTIIWLYKEIKTKYNAKEEQVNARKNILLDKLSNINLLYQELKHGDATEQDFYKSVYASLQFMDYLNFSRVSALLESDQLDQDKKIREINEIVKLDFIRIKRAEQKWHEYDSLMGSLIKIAEHMKFLFLPIMYTTFTFLMFVYLLILWFSSENPMYSLANMIGSFFVIMYLIAAFDLILQKKMHIRNAIYIFILLSTSVLLLAIRDVWIILLDSIIMGTTFTLFVSYNNKLNKNRKILN
ncbi:hypothetical protein ACIQLG_14060 [Terribacillus saccharophilus]|uniref:hypothetical protein n=1 Tax=Terribacillus saccharophilus TaxID=361277 RepID=UPI003829AE25